MRYEGFAAVRQRSQRIASALREFALLIGEPRLQSLTLSTGEGVLPGLGMLSEAKTIEQRATDAERGVFKVLVLGRFKNGKSTLLNAMLGARVLPTSAVPATAIITVLVGGNSASSPWSCASARAWPDASTPISSTMAGRCVTPGPATPASVQAAAIRSRRR
ncbi:MAG: dynamin family protein [Dehalococcoidia bacterium]